MAARGGCCEDNTSSVCVLLIHMSCDLLFLFINNLNLRQNTIRKETTHCILRCYPIGMTGTQTDACLKRVLLPVKHKQAGRHMSVWGV